MSTPQILVIAGLVNVFLLVSVSLAAAGVKLRRERHDRAAAAELDRLRPVLLEYLVSWEDADARDLADTLIGHHAAAASFEQLVAGLLPKLRGADRSALVDILRRRGTIDAACLRTRDRRSGRRGTAAELLGAAGAVEGIPFVVPLLRDRDPQVRLAAVRALGRIGTTASAAALLERLDRDRPGIPPHPVTMALLRIGTDATEPLLSALHADHVAVRGIAAEVLGVLGILTAAGPLERRIASDGEPRTRTGAAHALGRIGLPGSVPALVGLLRTEDDVDVLVAACTSLGTIADPACISALVWALADDAPAVRLAAAGSLVQLGGAGLDCLRVAAQQGRQGADAAREVLTAHALAMGALTVGGGSR